MHFRTEKLRDSQVAYISFTSHIRINEKVLTSYSENKISYLLRKLQALSHYGGLLSHSTLTQPKWPVTPSTHVACATMAIR
jgi:hypothetical protein